MGSQELSYFCGRSGRNFPGQVTRRSYGVKAWQPAPYGEGLAPAIVAARTESAAGTEEIHLSPRVVPPLPAVPDGDSRAFFSSPPANIVTRMPGARGERRRRTGEILPAPLQPRLGSDLVPDVANPRWRPSGSNRALRVCGSSRPPADGGRRPRAWRALGARAPRGSFPPAAQADDEEACVQHAAQLPGLVLQNSGGDAPVGSYRQNPAHRTERRPWMGTHWSRHGGPR